MDDVEADRVFEQAVARSRVPAQVAITCAAILAIATSMLAAPDLRGVAGSLLALTMLAVAVIDARRFVIPDQLSAIGFALALFTAGIQDPDAVAQAIAASALRGVTLALLFLGL